MNLQIDAKLAFLHRLGMRRGIFPPVEGICISLHKCCFNFYELSVIYIVVKFSDAPYQLIKRQILKISIFHFGKAFFT